MSEAPLPLDRILRQELLHARERVYRFGQATPLERLHLPEMLEGPEIWIKREDLATVKSYKWRGACNLMSTLSAEERQRGVITASAGNHAQGVALAAQALKIHARIFMPRSTPKVKQNAVRLHGGEWVEIVLSGDSYDAAVHAAKQEQALNNQVYVHAYDDIKIMAGQGTMADEVVLSGQGPFDAAFLQIGGGGMAAGVSCWLKTYWPDIKIIGVEGENQASMTQALQSGSLQPLDQVDVFCDGTAVAKAGTLCYEICKNTFDSLMLVNNAEVRGAVRLLWEAHRFISEPSGAMGLAALLQQPQKWAGKKVLLVISGANMDFTQIGAISQLTSVTSLQNSRTFRIKIAEQRGTMLQLLNRCFKGLNITDFQYGKQSQEHSSPIFTLNSDDAATLDRLPKLLNAEGYEWSELTDAVDVDFRAIPLRADLLAHPLFLRLDFYERAGALHDFLQRYVMHQASFCYFNYRQSGERIGRALIGLDFDSIQDQQKFLAQLPAQGEGFRSCYQVEDAVHQRLMGQDFHIG